MSSYLGEGCDSFLRQSLVRGEQTLAVPIRGDGNMVLWTSDGEAVAASDR